MSTDRVTDAAANALYDWLVGLMPNGEALNAAFVCDYAGAVNFKRALAKQLEAIAALRANQSALPEVTELARSVDFADKCKAALNSHLQAIPSTKDSHLEAWCATRNQLWRCHDDAERKQAAALESYRARLLGAKP